MLLPTIFLMLIFYIFLYSHLLYQTSRPRNIHHHHRRHRRRRHRGRHLLTRSMPCWRPPKRRGPPPWRRTTALEGSTVLSFGALFLCVYCCGSPKIKKRHVIMILFLLGSFLFSKGFFGRICWGMMRMRMMSMKFLLFFQGLGEKGSIRIQTIFSL